MAELQAIEKFQGEFYNHSGQTDIYEAPSSTGYSSVYWSVKDHALARDKYGDYWRLATCQDLNSTIEKINTCFANVFGVLEAKLEGMKDVASKGLKEELEQIMDAKLAQIKADLQLDETLAKQSAAHEAKLQQLKSEVEGKIADMQLDRKLADHQAMMGAKFAEVKQDTIAELGLAAKLADFKAEQEAKLQQLKSEFETKVTDMQLDTKLADQQATMGAKIAEVKQNTIAELQLEAKLSDLKAEHEAKYTAAEEALESGLKNVLHSTHAKLQDELEALRSGVDNNHGSLRDILMDVTKQVDVLTTGLEEESNMRLEVEGRLGKACNELRDELNVTFREAHAAHAVELAELSKNSGAMREAQSALEDKLGQHKLHVAKNHEVQLDAKLSDLKAEHEAKLKQHRVHFEDHQATVGASLAEMKADLQLDAKLAKLSSAQEEKLQKLESELKGQIADLQKAGTLAIVSTTTDAKSEEVDAKPAENQVDQSKLKQIISVIVDAKVAHMQEDYDRQHKFSACCMGRSEYE